MRRQTSGRSETRSTPRPRKSMLNIGGGKCAYAETLPPSSSASPMRIPSGPRM
jgi:hypothetical protein